MTDKVLTLTQFSRRIGVDVRTLYKLREYAPLPPLAGERPPKAGSSKFYREGDLQAWYAKVKK